MDYIALIRKDGDSSYGVEFPDFPGCISAGETLDEAYRNAAEALSLHIDGMVADGDDIPAPSRLEDVMSLPESENAVATLVHAPDKTRSVRINVTMDNSLLERIDKAAALSGRTRSGFLAEGARRMLSNSGKAN